MPTAVEKVCLKKLLVGKFFGKVAECRAEIKPENKACYAFITSWCSCMPEIERNMLLPGEMNIFKNNFFLTSFNFGEFFPKV